ncbi:MAG: helix-turn-helix domain-containing protein [Nocardioidaceae bacterium]
MSEQPTIGTIPAWDLADRMRKALRQADANVGEMAEYLGVSRGTVSTWINGRIDPSTQTLRLWALRCGVPYPWLRYGDEAEHSPSPQARPTREYRCAPITLRATPVGHLRKVA